MYFLRFSMFYFEYYFLVFHNQQNDNPKNRIKQAYQQPPFETGTARTDGPPRWPPSMTTCRSPGRLQACIWVRWSCRWIYNVPSRYQLSHQSCWISTETLWPAGQRPPRTARPCFHLGTHRSPAPGLFCSPERLWTKKKHYYLICTVHCLWFTDNIWLIFLLKCWLNNVYKFHHFCVSYNI